MAERRRNSSLRPKRAANGSRSLTINGADGAAGPDWSVCARDFREIADHPAWRRIVFAMSKQIADQEHRIVRYLRDGEPEKAKEAAIRIDEASAILKFPESAAIHAEYKAKAQEILLRALKPGGT